MSNTSIPNVSQQLLLKYDSNFNKQLDKMNALNNEISTKNKMIYTNYDDEAKKDIKTIIYSYLVWYLIILTVIIILKATNIIGWPFLIAISILIALVLFYRMYMKHFNMRMANLTKLAKETGDDFANNLESAYANAINSNGYTCPVECLPEESSTIIPSITDIEAKKRYLSNDSNRDVWLKGDIPNNTYTIDDENKTYKINNMYVTAYGYDKQPYIKPDNLQTYRTTIQELEDNRPQRQIIPISKKQATYYDCSFIGGENSESPLPYKNQYNYTTIPCEYYPGFREDARYICDNDPKTNSDANCTKV